jgi:N,N'-diacetylchitobiose transport system substrate-binding protein
VKRRNLIAVGIAAALLGTAACGSSDSGNDDKASETPKNLTVWLQVDAQQSWPDAVAAATKAVEDKHPGTKVDVQYQQWTDHLTKLDAALAGNTPPDVVELGNTEMTKYMAAGAFADLTDKKSQFDNSGTWLKSLEESSTYDGKLYGVPYYAGSRAVIYRKDMFEQAGVQVPTTYAELEQVSQKLMDANKANKNFSAFWIPGRYWIAGMSWVKGGGGEIAVKDGDKWAGQLSSPESQAALTKYADFVKKYSRADMTGDESQQPQTFAKGNSAMIFANGWEWGVITDPKAGDPTLDPKLGAFPLPGDTPGQYTPTFLGGSDLAVTAKSKAQALAAEWIAAFTSNQTETDLATKASVIPNTTSLVQLNKDNPKLAPFAEAATSSWFVPTAPNWANVEKETILQNMLVDILTGKSSVADATKDADSKLNATLNAAS